MEKKLIYFNGVVYSGRHFAGEKLLCFLFKDVATGKDLNKFENVFGESTPTEEILNHYNEIADVLWIPSNGGIKILGTPFEAIKIYYGSLDSNLNCEVKNKDTMIKFNPENPQLASNNQKIKLQ